MCREAGLCRLSTKPRKSPKTHNIARLTRSLTLIFILGFSFQVESLFFFVIYFGSLREAKRRCGGKKRKDENWICCVFIQSHMKHIRERSRRLVNNKKKCFCVLNRTQLLDLAFFFGAWGYIKAFATRVANFRRYALAAMFAFKPHAEFMALY